MGSSSSSAAGAASDGRDVGKTPSMQGGDFAEVMKVHLQRLIVYAQDTHSGLQRPVAERLAERREQIVKLGGLELLLPLAESPDTEVQRLAAHALANLSVSPDNQASIAAEGGIDILVKLLGSTSEKVVQQAAKGLANLGVNSDNKASIAAAGGIPPLIQHAASPHAKVRLEAIAALANLAVNDDNERSIGEQGGLEPILAAAQGTQDGELLAQCARALRNLSVDSANKERLLKLGGTEVLLAMAGHSLEKVSQQSNRALANLRASANRSLAAAAGGEGGAARHK